MAGQIATRGIPAPIQAGHRWVIERTHAWGNQDGKLRWCTERRRLVVAFWLALCRHRLWPARPPCLDPLSLKAVLAAAHDHLPAQALSEAAVDAGQVGGVVVNAHGS
jgi:hypothetical protein